MASYRGHLMFSTALGAVYGGAGAWFLGMDWGPAIFGAGITAVSGLLPDLDSNSGVPIRELFGLGAVMAPLFLLHRLIRNEFSLEQILVIMGAVYFLVRYGLSRVFRKLTVHRGIFHSVPAMAIAGLIVFDLYKTPNLTLRLFVAGGVALGFLSHLVLDELCSVDFNGLSIKLNKFAGSALKFTSKSFAVTLVTYLLLAALSYDAYIEISDYEPGEGAYTETVVELRRGRRRRARIERQRQESVGGEELSEPKESKSDR